MLPAAVHDLIAAHFGAPPHAVVPAVGGFSNLTVRAQIGTTRCVLKAATTPAKRADVRHEALLLPLLHTAALPTPPLLATLDGMGWTVNIMPEISGQHGLSVLSNNPADLPMIYQVFGQVLRNVHTLPLVAVDLPASHFHFAERAAHAAAQLTDLALPPRSAAAIQDALAHPIWQTEPCLIHGDCGLHNILWGEQFWLLDWEWAGTGPALLDLAWLRWTLAWRALPPALWDAFCTGYGPLPTPLDPPLVQTLALAQIGLILARVADQPDARTEWIRRVEWTLAMQT